MAPLIVSTLMWSLVFVLIVFRRARKERSILYAAIAIALSMMLSDDDLYIVVDGWFGANDIMHVASAIALMVGIYYLAAGIAKAGEPTTRDIWRPILLVVAIALVSLGFFLVPHEGGTSTTFMLTYGHTFGAFLYSSAQYTYIAIVLVGMATTAVRILRGSSLARERVAGILLLTGASFGIALSADILLMNFSNLNDWAGPLDFGQALYFPLQIIMFAFLCAGLATAPITRWVIDSRRTKDGKALLEQITPLWVEATTARASLRLENNSTADEHRLHRRIVEIRDAAMDGRNDFALTDEDRALLRVAEDHLLAGAR